MKYIRTKDRIIYVGDLVKDKFGNYCKAETIETDMEVDGKYIIKEADTIKELCDEFVCAYLDGFCQIISFPSKIDAMLGHSVYGAIWTDIGLIYVAKMNDKGDLELL